MTERTLSIIKPEAVHRGLIGEILRRFESAGVLGSPRHGWSI